MTHPADPAASLWWAAAGTAQPERQLPYLLPTDLRLDRRTLAELLAYLARFGQHVAFYTAPDQPPAGHWGLGGQRHTLLLALMAAQPLPPFDPTPPRHRTDLLRVLTQLREAATRLHTWQYDYLLHEQQYPHPHQHDFVRQLDAIVTPLRDLLPEAASYEAALHSTRVLDGPLLLPADFVAAFETGQPLATTAGPAPVGPRADSWHGVLLAADLGRTLQDILRHFQSALEAVRGVAEQTLLSELQLRPNHEPEVGLLVAFARLYHYVQRLLNDIPSRHLLHYYQQELGFAHQPATPDQVYLQVVPAAGGALAVVPAGSQLSAGQDSQGRSILYATLEAARLSTWQVSVLQTLFVPSVWQEPGPALAPFSATDAGEGVAGVVAGRYVQGTYTSVLQEATPGAGIGPAVAPGWPLLGADPEQQPAFQPVMTQAQVGFAVAASVLQSGPGQREVRLTVQATPASFRSFTRWVRPDAAGWLAPQLAARLAAMFQVQATGPGGWLTPSDVRVEVSADTCTLTWVLTLDRTQPALAGYSQALHGEALTTTQPALLLQLRPASATHEYGYSIFRALRIKQVQVSLRSEPLTGPPLSKKQVQVGLRSEPLTGLILSNQQGALSAKAPFYPFGSPALRGSYLELGLPELLGKYLRELTLTLTWQNLPQQGFETYYAGYAYDPPLKQASFEVLVRYAQHNSWTEGKTTPLFPADTCHLGPGQPIDPLPYTQLTLQEPGELSVGPDGVGMVQVQLMSPGAGFGTSLYPDAINQVVYENAQHLSQLHQHQHHHHCHHHPPHSPHPKPAQDGPDTPPGTDEDTKKSLFSLSKFTRSSSPPSTSSTPPAAPAPSSEPAKEPAETADVKWPRPLPQPPLVPQVRSLKVSYYAEQQVQFGTAAEPTDPTAFYHLQPFATYQPAPAGGAGRLLPPLPEQGTLYVGLSPAAAGQFVSLVFDLVAPPGSGSPLRPLCWAYLDGNDCWQSVPQDPSLGGAMPGFVDAYRVALELPAHLPTTHRRMPSGLHWLRAQTTRGGSTAYGTLAAIYPRLTLARRLDAGAPNLAPYQQPLPAGTLTQLLTPLAAVKAVVQPLPSFGGSPAESPTDPDQATYYTRVSEQLRHRNRALSPWDYERLLLTNFPNVYVAKCVTATQLRQPGQLVVAALPVAGLLPGQPQPLFGVGQLAAMRTLLLELAPASVQLRVQNPCYEPLQVLCGVDFRTGVGAAPFGYEQQLQLELVAFLSPWAAGGAGAPPRGFGRIGPGAIVAFITSRPYVRQLRQLTVVCNGSFWEINPQAPSQSAVFGSPDPWVVLTSAPLHDINGNNPGAVPPVPPTSAPVPPPAAPVPPPPSPGTPDMPLVPSATPLPESPEPFPDPAPPAPAVPSVLPAPEPAPEPSAPEPGIGSYAIGHDFPVA